MKHVLKTLAAGLFLLTISMGAYANTSYPIYTGNLNEVSYKTILEGEDFILIEIDGKVYRIPLNK